MMMTKEQMMNDVIRRYGFENKWTVWFCELAETLTESQLLNAYILLDANVLCNVEEDESADTDYVVGTYEIIYIHDYLK